MWKVPSFEERVVQHNEVLSNMKGRKKHLAMLHYVHDNIQLIPPRVRYILKILGQTWLLLPHPRPLCF
jgi:hypothetical protein